MRSKPLMIAAVVATLLAPVSVAAKDCSSKIYTGINGSRWEQMAFGWNEYRGDGSFFAQFEEFTRDAQFIYLRDPNRRGDDGTPLQVRIPLCGGVVQWTWGSPLNWTDVTLVKGGR